MEILKVENLNKTYGKGENQVKAVDNISFSVEKGEFVAIIGASGSGKSTLLHLIGGVDRSRRCRTGAPHPPAIRTIMVRLHTFNAGEQP